MLSLLCGIFDANATQDLFKKSTSFHYEKYPESNYSKNVAVINWDSKEGIERFNSSQYKGDFFRLAHHFKPQSNPAACAQASGTIILSAIYELSHKPFPIVEEWAIPVGDKKYSLEYRLLNEHNFFNEKTDKVLDRRVPYLRKTKEDGTFGGGMDIEDLQKMLKIHGASSKLVNVNEYSEKNVDGFRELLKSTLNSDKKFIILNYDHSYKGLMGGHFSPVAAYDEVSDSVLILDVAAHRNPWVWINTSDLYHAMNTKNYAQTAYRGYLVIDAKI